MYVFSSFPILFCKNRNYICILFCRLSLSSNYRCKTSWICLNEYLIRFKSGLWLGHSRTLLLYSKPFHGGFCQVFCHCSTRTWMFTRTSLFWAPSILPLMATSFPVPPPAEKTALGHSTSCLTAELVLPGLRATFGLEPNTELCFRFKQTTMSFLKRCSHAVWWKTTRETWRWLFPQVASS